jgi:hypothetical protein
MKQFPDLDELHLIGSSTTHSLVFGGSDLSHRLSLFKGTSLTLRSACFMRPSLAFLKQIGFETVTSLNFHESKIRFKHIVNDNHSLAPIFPNLKKVKFIGTPVSSDQYQVYVFEHFADLFLVGCQLTHFEISYGFGPFCCGKHVRCSLIDEKLQRMMKANVAYKTARKNSLHAPAKFS